MLLSFIAACSQSPTKKYHDAINAYHLITQSYDSLPYHINVLTKNVHDDTQTLQIKNNHGMAHIYFEGDGIPWFRGQTPAQNPTSKSLLALHLMQKDRFPSFYINRPCYGEDILPSYCHAALWTSDRYSEKIVESLNTALDKIQQRYSIKKFIFIGYSGGGSLALLSAATRQDVAEVITISANIDHQRWTDMYGMLPLSGSLNPVNALPQLENTYQLYLAGGKDQIIPSFLLTDILKNYGITQAESKKGKIILREAYTHHCCWLNEWESIIELTQKRQH